MLNGERVLLRPIQRGDLPRLWELISDFEVAVLGSSGPVVPRSLAQFEAGFDQELTKDHNDRAWVRGRYEDELVMAILREDWTPRA
jgi:hypothetical protein